MSFFEDLEDKFWKLLEDLEYKGIPLIKLAYFLDDRKIPAMPVFALISLLILVGLGFGVYNLFLHPQASVTLTVLGEEAKPLDSVEVKLKVNDELKTLQTKDGKIQLNVPIGAKLSIEIEKEGYEKKEKSFTVDEVKFEQTLTLLPLSSTISKTIKLVNADKSLFDKSVSASFSCSGNTGFTKSEIVEKGEVKLDNIPSDCGNLSIFVEKFNVKSNAINLDEKGSAQIVVDPIKKDFGKVRVEVKKESDEALSGISVELFTSQRMAYTRGITAQDGTTVFENVEVDNYYIVASDGSGEFLTFDGSSNKKDVLKDQTTSFTAVMKKGIKGEVKLKVINKQTSLPIANAIVTLLKADGSKHSEPKQSDAEGKVSFNVPDAAAYKAVVDHPDYLFEEKGDLRKTELDEFTLIPVTEATADNRRSLLVRVLDEKGVPVDAVKTVLQTGDGTPLGLEKITGGDGIVSFGNLKEGEYLIFAVKTGFKGVLSQKVQVRDRKINLLDVKISLGTGTVELTVLDEDNQPVSGATVTLYDYFTDEQLEKEKLVDAQGKVSFTVRADKKIYLKASANNFLNYVTIPLQLANNVTIKKEIKLVDDVASVEAKLVGLFVSTQEGDQEVKDSLNPGDKYKVRLQVITPKNSSFEEIGLHVRTGKQEENKTNIMEADPLFIKEVFSSASQIRKGTSYTPSLGFSNDAIHLTSGAAKWINSTWRKPLAGVYELEAEIQVNKVEARDDLKLYYRAWAKSGAYVRDPADKELGNTANTAKKQELYAHSKEKTYSVGVASNVCVREFCSSLTIEDLFSNLETGIVDQYSAKITNNYKLRFNLVNGSSSTFSGLKFKVFNELGGVELQNYKIEIQGKELIGNAENNEINLDVSKLAGDEPISGEINFKTSKDGQSKVVMQLISGRDTLFEKQVLVDVSPAQTLKVEVMPKAVVPFINNHFVFKVTKPEDNSAIPNALIRLMLNETVVVTGNTDSRGEFEYTLTAPTSGAKLLIEVEKNGFQKVKKVMNVAEEILDVNPLNVVETLIVSGVEAKTNGLTVFNDTEIPLKISKVDATGDFTGLVNLEFRENLIDLVLNPKRDYNFQLDLGLTAKGKEVSQPQRLQGKIDLHLTNEAFNKTWINSIPVEVKIAFGSAIDQKDCLTVNPLNWNVFTSNEVKTLDVTVKNTCEVQGKPVDLQGLEVKINRGNENELGAFKLRDELTEKEVTLTNVFQKISTLLKHNADNVYTIRFEPQEVTSSTSEPKIIFRATHRTANGDEVIEKLVKVKVEINDLIKCVEVKETGKLVVESCPYNVGFSAARYSVPIQGVLPEHVLTSGTLSDDRVSLLQSRNPVFPNLDYTGRLFDSYNQNPAAAGIFACQDTQFRIENNCSSIISVDLAQDSALNVAESAFDLEPGKDKVVNIGQSYKMGTYKVRVQAKIKGANQASQEIKTVSVSVKSSSQATADCIKLSDPGDGVFRFNDIFQKPVRGVLTNQCVGTGVYLYKNSLDTSSLVSYTGQQMQMASRLITEGDPDPTTRFDGKEIQELKFRVEKNLFYKKADSLNQLKEARGPLDLVTGVRAVLAQGYVTVNEAGYLKVSYTDGFSQSKSKEINITFQDYFRSTEFLDTQYGSTKWTTAADLQAYCLRPLYLGTLTDTDFGNTDTITKRPADDLVIVGADACGSPDGLSNLKVNPNMLRELSEKGLDLSFRITKGKLFAGAQSIEAVITRTDKFVEPLTIDSTKKPEYKLKAQFNRVSPFISKEVEIDVQFTVMPKGLIEGLSTQGQKVYLEALKKLKRGESIDAVLAFVDSQEIDKDPDKDKEQKDLIKQRLKELVSKIAEATFCSTEKGEVQTALFDKVYLNWDYGKIYSEGEKNCSSGEIYCDGVQFSIELTKRQAKVKDIMETTGKNYLSTGGNLDLNKVVERCAVYDIGKTGTAIDDLAESDCTPYLKSSDLWRFGKLSYSPFKGKAYFLKDDLRLLEWNKKDDLDRVKKRLSEAISLIKSAPDLNASTDKDQLLNIQSRFNKLKEALLGGGTSGEKDPLSEHVFIEFNQAPATGYGIGDDKVLDSLNIPSTDKSGLTTPYKNSLRLMKLDLFMEFLEDILENCLNNLSQCKTPSYTLTRTNNVYVKASGVKQAGGNVTVDTNLLNQVLTDFEVKIGIPINVSDKEVQDFVLGNAMDAIKLQDSQSNSFTYRQLRDLSQFNSYLMADNLNENLRADFKAKYSATANTDFENWNISGETNTPGKYESEINYRLTLKEPFSDQNHGINYYKILRSNTFEEFKSNIAPSDEIEYNTVTFKPKPRLKTANPATFNKIQFTDLTFTNFKTNFDTQLKEESKDINAKVLYKFYPQNPVVKYIDFNGKPKSYVLPRPRNDEDLNLGLNNYVGVTEIVIGNLAEQSTLDALLAKMKEKTKEFISSKINTSLKDRKDLGDDTEKQKVITFITNKINKDVDDFNGTFVVKLKVGYLSSSGESKNITWDKNTMNLNNLISILDRLDYQVAELSYRSRIMPHASKTSVNLTRLEADQASSEVQDKLLYYLPLDGSLGIENDKSNREGYGVTFSSQDGFTKIPVQKELQAVSGTATVKKDFIVPKAADGNAGFTNFLMNFETKINQTTDGRLLQFVGGTGTSTPTAAIYSPSFPVPLTMRVNAPTSGSLASVFYNLSKNASEVDSSANPNPAALVSWKVHERSQVARTQEELGVIAMSFTGEDKEVNPDMYYSRAGKEGSEGFNVLGLQWQGTLRPGFIVFKGMAFVPQGKGDLQLTLNKNSLSDASIETVALGSKPASIKASQGGKVEGAVSLDPTIVSPGFNADAKSLKDLATKIKNGENISLEEIIELNKAGFLCAKIARDELTLSWNEDKVIETSGLKQKADSLLTAKR